LVIQPIMKYGIPKCTEGETPKSEIRKGEASDSERILWQNREYAIRKMQTRERLNTGRGKRKKEKCDGEMKAALAKMREIFDCPCGQRLQPLNDLTRNSLICEMPA